MLDVVTIGETMAVFTPDLRGKLRYIHNFNLKVAGAESNLAIGMKKLGYSTGWISKLGVDELGNLVFNTLKSEGVDVSNVCFDTLHSTGVMIKEFSSFEESNVYYYRENSAASFINPDDIKEEYLKDSKLLHLTGITPILSDSCSKSVEKLIDIAHKNNMLISFDPNIRLKLWKNNNYSKAVKTFLTQSDIVMLGLKEATLLYNSNDIRTIFSLILINKNIRYLAVKDGKNGAWVGSRTEFYKIDPYPCNAIDPIGAGDAFNAGFLFGLLENYSLKKSGEIGAICGALATQCYGDFESYPSKDEVLNILSNSQQISR